MADRDYQLEILDGIEELKHQFDAETNDADEKSHIALQSLYKTSELLKETCGWSMEYLAACIMASSQKEEMPLQPAEKVFHHTENVPDTVKREILSVLLRVFPTYTFSEKVSDNDKREVMQYLMTVAPQSIFHELAIALRESNDGQNPKLLKSTLRKRAGNRDLWMYRVSAIIHIGYFSGLYYSRNEAIEKVSKAFDEDYETVEEWTRRKKRPWVVNELELKKASNSAKAAAKEEMKIANKKQMKDRDLGNHKRFGENMLKMHGEFYQQARSRVREIMKQKGLKQH